MLGQTLSRDRFEIVVIKSFRDPEVEKELESAGAVVLYDEEPRIGRWLRHAIRRARAPVITFLDDDDEYEPNRLVEMLDVWHRHPGLGFYRNRVRVIDEAGRAVPAEQWRSHETDAALDRMGPVYLPSDRTDGLLELASRTTTATFGSSTMAIRRDLLEGVVGDAFERTQLPDLFLFLAAALSREGVYLDDRRLTRYRFYGGNVTHSVRWLDLSSESQSEMAALASRLGREDLAGWLEGLSAHYGRLFRKSALVERIAQGADRREVVRLFEEYFRFLGHRPRDRGWEMEAWVTCLYTLGHLGLPSVAGRIARSRLHARLPN